MRKVTTRLLVFLLLTLGTVNGPTAGEEPATELNQSNGRIPLPLAKEHRHTHALDISSDGHYLLMDNHPLFRPATVSVVDVTTGEKLVRWRIKGLKYGYFTPDGHEVLLRTWRNKPGLGTRLGNIATGKAPEMCPGPPIDEVFNLTPAGQGRAIGYSVYHSSPGPVPGMYRLKTISLENCSTLMTKALDTEGEEVSFMVGSFAFQGGDVFTYLAYRLRDGFSIHPEKIWIRDVSSFEVKTRIPRQEGSVYDQIAFTPDGRAIVAQAMKVPRVRGLGAEYQTCRVFVFDTASGKLLRSLDIKRAVYGLAVSPDGSFLATAKVLERDWKGKPFVRGVVGLYDFRTGQALAHAEFPWVRKPKGIESFGGKVNGIFLSADSRQLIASTDDTRIWDIPEELALREEVESKCATCDS